MIDARAPPMVFPNAEVRALVMAVVSTCSGAARKRALSTPRELPSRPSARQALLTGGTFDECSEFLGVGRRKPRVVIPVCVDTKLSGLRWRRGRGFPLAGSVQPGSSAATVAFKATERGMPCQAPPGEAKEMLWKENARTRTNAAWRKIGLIKN